MMTHHLNDFHATSRHGWACGCGLTLGEWALGGDRDCTIAGIDKALGRQKAPDVCTCITAPELCEYCLTKSSRYAPTRVVLPTPSPCRAPAEPLTAGQVGIARAVERLNSADRGFMPCAARWLP